MNYRHHDAEPITGVPVDLFAGQTPQYEVTAFHEVVSLPAPDDTLDTFITDQPHYETSSPARSSGAQAVAAEVSIAIEDEPTSEEDTPQNGDSAVTEETSPRYVPVFEPLVMRAVAGDLSARDELIREIRPIIVDYCRSRLGGSEPAIGSADDIAQETCIAIMRALPRYEPKGIPFRHFMFTVAERRFIDTYRSIERNKSEPVAEVPDVQANNVAEPMQHILDAERGELLSELLQTLPPKQRELLTLRVVNGLTSQEAADIVGSTPQAVRVAQHRIIKRLRDEIASKGRELKQNDPDYRDPLTLTLEH